MILARRSTGGGDGGPSVGGAGWLAVGGPAVGFSFAGGGFSTGPLSSLFLASLSFSRSRGGDATGVVAGVVATGFATFLVFLGGEGGRKPALASCANLMMFDISALMPLWLWILPILSKCSSMNPNNPVLPHHVSKASFFARLSVLKSDNLDPLFIWFVVLVFFMASKSALALARPLSDLSLFIRSGACLM